MMKKGDQAIVQLKIQWETLPAEAATWEDHEVLRRRFPLASIWEEPRSEGEDNVTADN
jgi:hypothetical protein